jgi:hypothetical protein
MSEVSIPGQGEETFEVDQPATAGSENYVAQQWIPVTEHYRGGGLISNECRQFAQGRINTADSFLDPFHRRQLNHYAAMWLGIS